jgi:hypothetical protein
MSFIAAEKQIVEGVKECIAGNGFLQQEVDLDDEHHVSFVKKTQGLQYKFNFKFLFYDDNVLGIEPRMIVSYDSISKIVNKALGTDDEYYAVSTRLGALLNQKNKDGFFNSNENVEIEFKVTEANIKKAIAKVYDPFFVKAGSLFMEKTSSLKDLDTLINGWVLKSSALKAMAYFGSNRPWQITTGIIAAKLVKRPDYDQLLERYLAFAETKDPESNDWIKNFYTIVDYLKKMK